MKRIGPASSILVASFVAALACLAPSGASAQDSVRIGSDAPIRNWYVGGGIGATFGLDGGPALFVLNEEGGYQLDPILLGNGIDLQLRFGLDLTQQLGDFYIFTFGARASASFGLWSNGDITLRVTPSLLLGGAILAVDEVCTVFGCYGGGTDGAFDLQFATQVELDLLEGMLTVFFRPLSVDGYFGDGSTSRWNMIAGAYVHF